MEPEQEHHTFSLKDLAYGGGLFIASAAGAALGAHAMRAKDISTNHALMSRLNDAFTDSSIRIEQRREKSTTELVHNLINENATILESVTRNCETRMDDAIHRYEASRVESAAAGGDPAAIMQLIRELQERMDRSNRELRDHFSGIISQHDTISERSIHRIQEQFRQETSTCQRRMQEIASGLLQKVDAKSSEGQKLLEALDASFARFNELNQQFKTEMMHTLRMRAYGSEQSFDPDASGAMMDSLDTDSIDEHLPGHHPAKNTTPSPPPSPMAAVRPASLR